MKSSDVPEDYPRILLHLIEVFPGMQHECRPDSEESFDSLWLWPQGISWDPPAPYEEATQTGVLVYAPGRRQNTFGTFAVSIGNLNALPDLGESDNLVMLVALVEEAIKQHYGTELELTP